MSTAEHTAALPASLRVTDRAWGAWLLGAAALAAGALYVPGIPSAATAGRWWAAGIAGAVLLWWRSVPWTPAHWAGVALLAWAALGSWLWAVSGLDATSDLLRLAAAGTVFAAGARAERGEVERAWLFFAAGVSASACFSLAQWAGYAPVWVAPGHIAGLFLTKNMAVEAGVVALVGAIAARYWWLAPGPALQVALAGGREGVVLLAVALLAAAWWLAPRARFHLAILAGLALIGTAVAIQLGAEWPTLRIADRLEVWWTALRSVNLWGDGLGSFQVAVQAYEHAHNEAVHFAFELGIGSLLMWFIFGEALRGEWVAAKVAIVVILAASTVWYPLHAPATIFMAALLAGHLARERAALRSAQHAG